MTSDDRGAAPPPAFSSPVFAPRPRPLPFRRTPLALPARQARSLATRERLLIAVEEVVRDVGLQKATVRAIAARAALGVGTLYRRFPNKAALLAAAGHRFMHRRQQGTIASSRMRRSGTRRHVLSALTNGALLAIERDRRLLQAFGGLACPEVDLHGALASVVGPLGAERLILALRALVLDEVLPSARPVTRNQLLRFLIDTALGGSEL